MNEEIKKVLKICDQLLDNPTRNPKTKRKIKKNGPTYKKLMKECDKAIEIEKKRRDQNKPRKPKNPKKRVIIKAKRRLPKPLPSLPPGLIKIQPGLRKPIMRIQKTEQDPICDIWLRFKEKNPKTGRKIKINGPTYKKFVKQCITNKEIRKNLTLIDTSVRKIVDDYSKKSVNLIIKKRTQRIRDEKIKLMSGTKLTELIMILYLLKKHKRGINILLRKDFKKMFKKINTNKMNFNDYRTLDYLTIVDIDNKTGKPKNITFPYNNSGMDQYFWASNNPENKQSKNRFTFLLMSIQSEPLLDNTGKKIIKKPWGHFNFMVYDKEENNVYRFEPNGGVVNFYNSPALDVMLKEKFKSWGDIGYKSMNDFCPMIPGKKGSRGPQGLENRLEEQLTDPGGFCAYWSIFFIDFIWALPPTRDTDIPTLIAGRTPDKNNEDSRNI
jgi:hypothetical protein